MRESKNDWGINAVLSFFERERLATSRGLETNYPLSDGQHTKLGLDRGVCVGA